MVDDPTARPSSSEGGFEATGEDAGALVELNALLGRGTRYAGKLYFEGRIRLEGRFEGEIRCADAPVDGVLVIGEGADVDGDIEVGVCIVTGGTVRAHIRARHAIELHAPAVVHGDLHAPNVFIDRGVTFEGNCKMAPLDAPEMFGDGPAFSPAVEPSVSPPVGPSLSPPVGPGPSDARSPDRDSE